MRRKLAKTLVRGVRDTAVAGATIAVGMARFAVDVMEEGVEAFAELGEHLEEKIEEIDDD